METASYTLLTPKERARLVLNTAFANNVEKYVQAYKTKRDAEVAGMRDSSSPIQSDDFSGATPSTNDGETNDGETSSLWSPSAFYASMLNYSIGYGTVLGFPRMCYKHGGGIFIIPYLVMLFLEGIPLVCIEIAIGQHFHDKFLLSTWKRIHPCTVGLGLSTIFISFVTIIYFNVIVGWCASYFVSSLQRFLPWSSCAEGVQACSNGSSPSEYYWYKVKLNVAEDINSFKDIKWDLYLYICIAWLLIFVYNIKGVKKAAKLAYAILMIGLVLYVTLFLLVVHLKDWARGLAILVEFKTSQMNKLLSIEIWRDAATQVFYSLGIGFGSILMYSSYNNPNFKCKTAAVCYGLVDTTVAICSCIIVFSLRGFQAHIKDDECMDKGLNQTLAQDEGFHDCNNSFLSQPIPDTFSLAFISWSESFIHIAYPPLWSSLSYLLLLLIGLGTMSGMVFVVAMFLREMIALKEHFATGLVCLVSCVLGFIFVNDSGLYMVNLFHGYSSRSIQWIALIEILSVICFFGRKNFCTMVEEMTGEKLHYAWIFCWFIVSPAILVALIFFSVYDLANTEGYFYTTWQPVVGIQDVLYPSWCYALIALFCIIPLGLIFGVFAIHCVKSRHLLFEMCHNAWKHACFWCNQEEEYELQDFTEVQRCYQTGGQVLLDRIDANFPELLSFDNVQGPLTNGYAHNVTDDVDYGSSISENNNNIAHTVAKPTRRLSI